MLELNKCAMAALYAATELSGVAAAAPEAMPTKGLKDGSVVFALEVASVVELDCPETAVVLIVEDVHELVDVAAELVQFEATDWEDSGNEDTVMLVVVSVSHHRDKYEGSIDAEPALYALLISARCTQYECNR